jgi:hypothetical protein
VLAINRRERKAAEMISVDDYLFFVDEALDGMVRIVTELGDDLANRRPDVSGANSPYAVLTHCLGVMEYWAGYLVAGRRIERDRDAEFEPPALSEHLLSEPAGLADNSRQTSPTSNPSPRLVEPQTRMTPVYLSPKLRAGH